jgi:hypothetical protein
MSEGERSHLEANWIFMLKIPKSNTIHWANLDSTGEKIFTASVLF